MRGENGDYFGCQFSNKSAKFRTLKDAEESCFPWHAHSTLDGTMSLSAKRAMCDTLMRLRRAREEEEIVGDEMQRLLCTETCAEQHGGSQSAQKRRRLDSSSRRILSVPFSHTPTGNWTNSESSLSPSQQRTKKLNHTLVPFDETGLNVFIGFTLLRRTGTIPEEG